MHDTHDRPTPTLCTELRGTVDLQQHRVPIKTHMSESYICLGFLHGGMTHPGTVVLLLCSDLTLQLNLRLHSMTNMDIATLV